MHWFHSVILWKQKKIPPFNVKYNKCFRTLIIFLVAHSVGIFNFSLRFLVFGRPKYNGNKTNLNSNLCLYIYISFCMSDVVISLFIVVAANEVGHFERIFELARRRFFFITLDLYGYISSFGFRKFWRHIVEI